MLDFCQRGGWRGGRVGGQYANPKTHCDGAFSSPSPHSAGAKDIGWWAATGSASAATRDPRATSGS